MENRLEGDIYNYIAIVDNLLIFRDLRTVKLLFLKQIWCLHKQKLHI